MNNELNVPGSHGIQIRHTGTPVHFKRESVQAEIVFVVDTTGSMSDKISGLMQTCAKFAGEAVRRQIACRMGILCFGDLTIEPPDRMVAFPLAPGAERIAGAFNVVLREHGCSGGGNRGESSIDALFKAMDLFSNNRQAVRVFLFFTDEPPLEPDRLGRSMRQAIGSCRERGITCFAVTVPDARFKSLAAETGGEWFHISPGVDFTVILDRLFPKVVERIQEIALQLPQGGQRHGLPGISGK
jgi:hypothetical protein